MTKEEFERTRAAIRAYTEKVTASPEAARAALTAEGIYRPDGSLAPEYDSKPED